VGLISFRHSFTVSFFFFPEIQFSDLTVTVNELSILPFLCLSERWLEAVLMQLAYFQDISALLTLSFSFCIVAPPLLLYFIRTIKLDSLHKNYLKTLCSSMHADTYLKLKRPLICSLAYSK